MNNLAKITYATAAILAALFINSCTGSSGKGPDPEVSGYPDTKFTVHSDSELIGGPLAQGQVGDLLLANDKIRVIVQKPRKNSGVNSFGGNIIDADIVRSSGEPGHDNFGSMFPLLNIEWTVNYRSFEVISDGSDGSAKKLRAHGIIDVYDYLDLNFIKDVALAVAGQAISFSNRFADRSNPFNIYDDLKGISPEVTTDYTLEPGKNYVRIETTITNGGDKDAKMPVGQYLNGSGELSMLIPGTGYSPDLMTQIAANTPAVIYAAYDDSDVSYGYFYNAAQFVDKDGKPYNSGSITYSEVTGLVLGEEILKLLPLGLGGTPEIHFTIPANSSRTITSFFVVGNGSAGSVMDGGLAATGALARPISGTVVDAGGTAVAGATVAVMAGPGTLITYRTDSAGKFSGMLPSGGNLESKRFGDGRYKVALEMPGYHKNGTSDAGTCEPAEIDLMTNESASVACTLGESGVVKLASPVTDADTGQPMPARLTIVGTDPSPNKVGGAGRFRSTYNWEMPFGIVDVKYITMLGTFDLTGASTFNLEPGTYLFVFSRGPEYTDDERVLEVPASGTLTLDKVSLKRVSKTPGYISSDFHVHSIKSPDSSMPQQERVLTAAADALDILQSSDHDFVTDYAPVVADMEAKGAIPAGGMKSASGDEVTPNHYGHLHVFPILADPNDPEGGAIDWSASPLDVVGFDPDYVLPLDDLVKKLRAGSSDRVVQVNHLFDNPTGLPLASGWVTTTFYMEGFGVGPLSSYADPVERRMPPRSSGYSFPVAFGTSGLMTTDYDAVELVVGPHLHDNGTLFRSALPTWFNLLNLGLIVTATADSDTHRGIAAPIGLPRNFIASSVDPADGIGTSHDEIDLKEYAASVKAHKVTISAGPIISVKAKGDSGSTADVGGTVTGKHATFTVDVSAPSWAWFDTIEVYANTEPVPVDDKTDLPMQGTAADPAVFYKPYHVPRYTYEPVKKFSMSEGTLTSWKQDKGVITASISFDMDVAEDTWVVVMARGTKTTKGYRSLFPIVTQALTSETDAPADIDPANIAAFHADQRVGASAWALANPIFMDVEGDGFVAKYIKEGTSPLGK